MVRFTYRRVAAMALAGMTAIGGPAWAAAVPCVNDESQFFSVAAIAASHQNAVLA